MLTLMSTNGLAKSPPMGWNSWDCYGMAIGEAEIFEVAQAMKVRLSEFGWRYLVIDAGWFNPAPRAGIQSETPALDLDDYGRLIPTLGRFPSAAGGLGFKPISAKLHDLGLKFGVHLMRGIPRAAVERNTPILGTRHHARDIANTDSRCVWNSEMYGVDMSKPGAQAYYDSVAMLFAEWGLDFVKADDMASPYYDAEIAALHQALHNTGRHILLSLSPGGAATSETHEHARRHSEMRRISKDLWDSWQPLNDGYAGLSGQFELARRWQGLGGPGHWPDLDMLPIGRLSLNGEGGQPRESRFTRDERMTMLTLWSIFQSPLMLGGDLPSLGSEDVSLLTNPEVIAVNQQGRKSRELFAHDAAVAWLSELGDGRRALALFNLHDTEELEVEISGQELGLSGSPAVRDLWARQDMGRQDLPFKARVPAHGARLFSLETHSAA